MNNPLKASVSSKDCSDTGMAIVLICLLLAWVTDNHTFLGAAIVALIINMTWPKIYSVAARVWVGFSHLLGSGMSKFLLSLIFFGLVAPLAVIRRAFGHDLIQLKKWKTGNESVFETRDHTYTAKEIEVPY